jgi:NADP-dependent 3-hydroxy acid dehydrogenase YdfG
MGVSVDLTGRRVLVTGASSGIGAAACRSIVGCGGSVAMLARREDRLAALHEELGERAVAVPGDVTDLDALAGVVAEAARRLGGLDGLVAAAGRTMAGGITSGTPERWLALFEDTGRRDVVVVGSVGAVTPLPSAGIYSASKRGLRAACDSLRLELAPRGIATSLVMPGMFEPEGLTLDGLEIDGDVPPDGIPYLLPGAGPGDPAVLGDTIAFMLGLPEGVGINELVVRPTGQLNP